MPPLRERPEDIPLLVRRFIKEFSSQHDRPFHGISAEAMQILMSYPWPGNVRELRNLIESMVVLAPGREIGPEDIPRSIREGGAARFLPVHVGPVVRGAVGAEGRELEFLVRSMLELRLQVEELRRRLDDEHHDHAWVGEVQPAGAFGSAATARAIEPPDQPAPPTVITLNAGMTMAEIERAAIESALRETRGNRRKAAEILDIGERTLYRKLRDYGIAPEELAEATVTAGSVSKP
jgi:DNA-binding NtrC family response regulator